MSISIVGDVIIDEYVYGTASRLSPEAPVPVIKYSHTEIKDGGAHNVFNNIKSLTDDVVLCSFSKTPPKKTRIFANGHYICRVDDESSDIIWETTPEYLSSKVVVISDYNKGALCEINLRQIFGKLIVDPKHDLHYFRGAWCIKPNKHEFSAYAGDWANLDELRSKMLNARNDLDITHLIVTLGQDGVAYANTDGLFLYLPAIAHDVYDVTGAGDTFTAVLAYAIHQELTMIDSIHLANFAASIAVQHHGNYIITKKDLGLYNKKVVFTNGCFDILHPGHIEYLKQSKALGDKLIVGLNSDSSIKRIKGENRPVNSESDRAAMLRALPFVDEVIIFNEDTPLELIKQIQPNIITKGGDYLPSEVVGRDLVPEVIIIPFKENYSTSKIIERIKNETHR